MGATEWIALLSLLVVVFGAGIVGLVALLWNMRIDARASHDDVARLKEEQNEQCETISALVLKVNTLENKVIFFQDGMIELKQFLKRHGEP